MSLASLAKKIEQNMTTTLTTSTTASDSATNTVTTTATVTTPTTVNVNNTKSSASSSTSSTAKAAGPGSAEIIAPAQLATRKKLNDYLEIDNDDLEIFERCGRGAYGSVYRGLWKSRNKIVAIKKLLMIEDEAEILGSCSHRNIIQFYGIVSKASNYCIITEYANYGSLNAFINSHDLYEEYGLELILKWAHDIALGMNYLHSEAPLKIIHRDLKSNNVLITNDGDELVCKICDFGSSRFGIQTTKMTVTGTFPWMSPEIIESKPANQKCDIWSYGVVLWELITGEVPFKGIEEFQIAFLVVERDQRLPIPQGCPAVLSTLMQICWQRDPAARPNFKHILQKLDKIDANDIDELFHKNKSKWEQEIEMNFERLKKIEDDLHIKEKLLEARERRLRELQMELIASTSRITLEDHDVNSWSEGDVCEWVKKIGQRNNNGLEKYAEKFLLHNINGKRLLMMNKNDVRSIGIFSEGDVIDLYHQIETLRIENTRLLNFPPLKQQVQTKNQVVSRRINFILLIGAHSIFESTCDSGKWKMYIDIDDCDENRDVNIPSCIRDVRFACRNSFDQYNVSKTPFIMRHWVKHPSDTPIKINCIITYDDKVVQPRKTTIEYELNLKKPETIVQRIELSLEDADPGDFKTTTFSSNHSSNVSTTTASAMICSNIQFQNMNTSPQSPLTPVNMIINVNGSSLFNENVWAKRNLENAVNIPTPTLATNSSSLWSGVVSGKQRPSDPGQIFKKRSSDNNFGGNVSADAIQSSDHHPIERRLLRSQTLVETLNHQSNDGGQQNASSNDFYVTQMNRNMSSNLLQNDSAAQGKMLSYSDKIKASLALNQSKQQQQQPPVSNRITDLKRNSISSAGAGDSKKLTNEVARRVSNEHQFTNGNGAVKKSPQPQTPSPTPTQPVNGKLKDNYVNISKNLREKPPANRPKFY